MAPLIDGQEATLWGSNSHWVQLGIMKAPSSPWKHHPEDTWIRDGAVWLAHIIIYRDCQQAIKAFIEQRSSCCYNCQHSCSGKSSCAFEGCMTDSKAMDAFFPSMAKPCWLMLHFFYNCQSRCYSRELQRAGWCCHCRKANCSLLTTGWVERFCSPGNGWLDFLPSAPTGGQGVKVL